MRILIIICVILSLSFKSIKETPSDFDSKISDIVSSFRQNIFNKSKCEQLRNEAEYVADEIEKALEDDDEEYSIEEKRELRTYKKEADALDGYIGAVGNSGNFIPRIADIRLANERVQGIVSGIPNNTFCIDIITISIGNYICYLAENNSTNGYRVNYKYKIPKSLNTGSGSFGVSAQSVRHIYDNREKPSQKKVTFYGITCTTF